MRSGCLSRSAVPQVRVQAHRWLHGSAVRRTEPEPSERKKQDEDKATEDAAMGSAGAVSASMASGGGFPASFVLPTRVPSVSKLTEAESSHRRRLLDILQALDLPPVLYAFAYGSGVFKQRPQTDAKSEPPPMIDMIFAVQNPTLWHERNMLQHPDHYPWWARMLGTVGIGPVQRLGGALWYNPYIEVNGQMIKYGVISIDTMCKDLLDWDTLYVSGRLHKPTATLFDATDGRVAIAQQANLTSALRTAFLLLPEHFTERELYMMVASLSYMGDFRMQVPGGEDRKKIANIVENQSSWFRILCSDLVTRFGIVKVQWAPERRWMSMQQDMSPHARAALASKLPLHLRQNIVEYYRRHPNLHSVFREIAQDGARESLEITRVPNPLPQLAHAKPSELHRDAYTGKETENSSSEKRTSAIVPPLVTRFWLAAVQHDTFQRVLREQVAKIVSAPARMQSLKGLYTAGFTRSLKYLWAKASKVRA